MGTTQWAVISGLTVSSTGKFSLEFTPDIRTFDSFEKAAEFANDRPFKAIIPIRTISNDRRQSLRH